MEIFEVKLSNGDSLKGRSFLSKNARANLLIMTGMCEHATRYEDFASFLNEKGISVDVLDAYGQGLNVDDLSKLGRWKKGDFMRNVEAAHLHIETLKKTTGLPTYILGHSMGSFMTQAFLCEYPHDVERAIIMSSMGPAKLLMKSGSFLAKLIVHRNNWEKDAKLLHALSLGSYSRAIKNRKTTEDWLSYNEENVKKYINDPYCHYRNSNGFYRVFLQAMAHLWDQKKIKKLNPQTEVLIVGGDSDPLSHNGKSLYKLKKMYEKKGLNVDLHIYERMRHEILNEDKHLDVYNAIADFLLV